MNGMKQLYLQNGRFISTALFSGLPSHTHAAYDLSLIELGSRFLVDQGHIG